MNLVFDDSHNRILQAETHVLVTGGPGCGKTTIALAKAKERIEVGLDNGQAVLFLSFSRAAVGRIVETSKLQLPKTIRTRLDIHTFHSFFWEVIRAYGYLLGAPKALQILLPHDERVLRDGAVDEDSIWDARRQRLFIEKGLVPFDLFAPKAYELLTQSKKLQSLYSSRYPLIIIDEAQDTADDQWNAVRLLGSRSQLVCLADLNQQIYDFRPGVTAERLTQIVDALTPIQVDLATANHRSPGSQIVAFGNDILLGTHGGTYTGVSRLNYRPDRAHRDAAIRSSTGIVTKKIKDLTGHSPQNIAVLTPWGRGVSIITRALTGDGTNNRIPHRVIIDEAPVILASRLIAFLLEPRRNGNLELVDLAEALELAASVFRSKGSKTALAQADRLQDQAASANKGEEPKVNTAGYVLLTLLRTLRAQIFSGDPKVDWVTVRKQLADSGMKLWANIAEYSEQIIAFQRGQKIATGLTQLWQAQGNYAGARAALDNALTQEHLLAGGDDLYGIHVMTIHKSKGKEFDAVVIFDDPKNSPLIYCKEEKPFSRSRRLLRVGITRAKHCVVILTDASSPSQLLTGYEL